ncbi:hypothetical protein BV378_32915 [Nostoc sp. RF31YmG]|nr:hypothetical protein BV378_32915 [Nostoc sp. RF31YmG]OUL34393.1 hypothetical protein BV375_04575 [Nostoc sp. 106C]
MLKLAVVPVMAVFSCLSTSNIALADYLNSEGAGGDYRYELWSSDDSSNYYLKIWSREASQESNPYNTTGNFTSSREALIYFDCNYAGKSLPECPK